MPRFDGYERNHDARYDIKFGGQLTQASLDEDELAQTVQHCTVELKVHRHQWEQTGKVFVEYSSHGKPSVLFNQDLDWYVIQFRRGDEEILMMFWLPRARLLEICERVRKEKPWLWKQRAGDRGAASGVALPLAELWS